MARLTKGECPVQDDPEPEGMTVTEVAERYWTYAKGYYVDPDGNPTTQLRIVQLALRGLRACCGRIEAESFSPRHLKAVRQHWIDSGCAHKTCNEFTSQVSGA